MNKIMVSGGLTRDSELKTTANGKDVLEFSLAVSDGQGDYKKVSYWNCKMWGDRAAKLHQYFVKGTRLLVEGKPELRQYEAKDGSGKRISPDIFVTDFEFMGGKKEQSSSDAFTDAGITSEPDRDSIPF